MATRVAREKIRVASFDGPSLMSAAKFELIYVEATLCVQLLNRWIQATQLRPESKRMKSLFKK